MNMQPLKVHKCRSENLPTFWSLHKNNVPKASHYNTFYFLKICMPEVCKMFVYKHTKTIKYFKNQPNF